MTGTGFVERVGTTFGRAPAIRAALGLLQNENLVVSLEQSASPLVRAGAVKPALFNLLGLGEIVLMSAAAQAKPETFGRFLTDLKMAKSPLQLQHELTNGVGWGLVCFRESKTDRDPLGFGLTLAKDVERKGLAFKLKAFEVRGEDGRYFEYLTFDTFRKQEATIQIFLSRKEIYGKIHLIASANLQWDSPALIYQLNRLFGSSWYLKQRPSTVMSDNAEEVMYSWLHVVDGNVEDENCSFAQTAIREEDEFFVISGIKITPREISAKEYHSQLVSLEDRLVNWIAQADRLPKVIPPLKWDLGLIRGERTKWQ